jgi:hypothetical protein
MRRVCDTLAALFLPTKEVERESPAIGSMTVARPNDTNVQLVDRDDRDFLRAPTRMPRDSEETPMSEHEKIAGRRLFLNLFAGAFAATLATRESCAADLPHLATSDPTASALGYTEDSTTVDAAKYSQHKPTQVCARCQQFTKQEGSAYGTCVIFAGKSVNERGWCGAYVEKA